jgi:hypothetical protein
MLASIGGTNEAEGGACAWADDPSFTHAVLVARISKMLEVVLNELRADNCAKMGSVQDENRAGRGTALAPESDPHRLYGIAKHSNLEVLTSTRKF